MKKILFLILFLINISFSYAVDSDWDGIINTLDPAPYDASIPGSWNWGSNSWNWNSWKNWWTVFNWDWLTTAGVKETIKDSNIWIWTSDNLRAVILWYVDFFMPYLWVFWFIALVYAGFLYVTSAANEENTDKAKNIIIYVILWIILVFLSYSIVSLFFNILG